MNKIYFSEFSKYCTHKCRFFLPVCTNCCLVLKLNFKLSQFRVQLSGIGCSCKVLEIFYIKK